MPPRRERLYLYWLERTVALIKTKYAALGEARVEAECHHVGQMRAQAGSTGPVTTQDALNMKRAFDDYARQAVAIEPSRIRPPGPNDQALKNSFKFSELARPDSHATEGHAPRLTSRQASRYRLVL